MILKAPLAAASLAAALFLVWTPASADRPVVVELFTSQGCSSCPPADRVLGELTGRADVLPLSFHVTYWDRLGWPDTFGLEAASERQRAYARAKGQPRVYTPQAVVDGRVEMVGSRRGDLHEVITILKDRQGPTPTMSAGDGQVEIGGADGVATLWLVGFDPRHTVEVERGENAGRSITYHNVVREIRELADWTGDPLVVDLPKKGVVAGERWAVILQEPGPGSVLGALEVPAAP